MRTGLIMVTTAALLLSACASDAAEPTHISARPQMFDDVEIAALTEARCDVDGMVKTTGGRLQAHGRQIIAPPAPPPPPPPPPPPAASAAPMVQAQMALAAAPGTILPLPRRGRAENRERYADIERDGVTRTAEAPVSTFAVDVDTGSYTNVRRMLNAGTLPPSDAVRPEEMINYFRYGYPVSADRVQPFSVSVDAATTPWNAETQLIRIGLKGYDVARDERPAANLVFLVDVSGSMRSADKLPLVRGTLRLLTRNLGPGDRVSIVTYAGRAAKLLDPTDDVARIEEAINSLCAGGSTAGADGLQLAYDAARVAYIDGGINRIMLTTDGDFNVGVTGDDALVDIVAREAETGVSLTTLGFGTGNFNEAMMEQVADRGNGNYAYIDGMAEAQKVLSEELESTLFTIARDVKIQVEWNPATVAEYRLLGYENRALAEEDFANDAVDAGEIGAGHDVTALYEIALVGSKGARLPPRRYGNADAAVGADRSAEELGELRLRYKLPDEETSRLIRQVMPASMARTADPAAGDMALAAAAAAFGQKLSDPRYLNGATYDDIAAMIDPDLPYARQFRSLVWIAGGLAPQGKPAAADE